jgi:hypothetical protein
MLYSGALVAKFNTFGRCFTRLKIHQYYSSASLRPPLKFSRRKIHLIDDLLDALLWDFGEQGGLYEPNIV